MLIPLGNTMHIKTRDIQKRDSTYQFALRIPADLIHRYDSRYIRLSLRTKDYKQAIRKAEPLAKQYLEEFDMLRTNDSLTPRQLTMTARELAESYETMDNFIEFVVDPKREQYAGSDEETFSSASDTEYLSPLEREAAILLREGLDVLRLSDAIQLYWKTHPRANEEDYRLPVERNWNRLTTFLGDMPVMSLSRANARDFIDHLLNSGLKTTSVRRILNHVNAILNTAITEAEINKQNPFKQLKIAGEGCDSTSTAVPTRKTLEDVVKAFSGDTSTTALLTLLLIETGPRIAEFSGMKVSDVFLDAPVPYVRVKPNEWRSVKTQSSIREFPLVGASLEAMKTLIAQPREGDALFPAYAKPRGQNAASAAVNKRLKKWGITSKGFRHALKDRLREAGCPKDIRDAIQGHESGDVAEVYGLGHTLETMAGWLDKIKL